MASKLFIGRLSYDTTEDGLREAFAAFGEVKSAAVIMDRETNRSKGFGFVEMADDDSAKAAIKGLDGQKLDGREIAVSEARERTDRNDRGPRNNGGGSSFRQRSW